jgi:hypothetical protein
VKVHIINPSDTAFGTAVINPRWLFVLAAATPSEFHDPVLCDETLEALDPATIHAGDVVGIGIYTGNAFRGYSVGRLVNERGATVILAAYTRPFIRKSVRIRRGSLRCSGRRRPSLWPSLERPCPGLPSTHL